MMKNILIVDDDSYNREAIQDDLSGMGLKFSAYESPMDAFMQCDKDWADVLVIDISCCSSILQPENAYGPILSILARQHNVKWVIINSAVVASTAEWVAEDLRERAPDIKVDIVSWSGGNPFGHLKDMIEKSVADRGG